MSGYGGRRGRLLGGEEGRRGRMVEDRRGGGERGRGRRTFGGLLGALFRVFCQESSFFFRGCMFLPALTCVVE